MTNPTTLGPPTKHVLERDDDLPLVFSGWGIGHGQIGNNTGRYTRVLIFLTVAGNLIGHTDRWTLLADNHVDQGPRTCSPPTTNPVELLKWLRGDNSQRRLGPASLDAWREACRNWPELGDAVEVVR